MHIKSAEQEYITVMQLAPPSSPVSIQPISRHIQSHYKQTKIQLFRLYFFINLKLNLVKLKFQALAIAKFRH